MTVKNPYQQQWAKDRRARGLDSTSFWLKKELKEKFKRICKEKDMSCTEMFSLIIEDWVNGVEKNA